MNFLNHLSFGMCRYKMADTGEGDDARNAIIRIMEQAAQLKLLLLESNTLQKYCFLDFMTPVGAINLWGIVTLLFHKHGVKPEEALRWCEANVFALQASLEVGQNTPEGIPMASDTPR